MKIHQGREPKAYVVAVYGTPGIGKSTLANGADKPFFINIEDALHHIDCDSSEVITSTEYVKQYLAFIAKGSDYNTIVLDTIDALEEIMIKEICDSKGKAALADFPFGQGFAMLNAKWVEILSWLTYTARTFNKNIIMVGHDQVKRHEDPMGDGWDRITLKMNYKSALTLVGKVDAVFYMTWDKVIRTTENKVRKAIGTGKRIIHTQETPAFLAKNRYELPLQMEAHMNFFSELEKITTRHDNKEHVLEPVME